jgi:hypothetical protein
MSLRFMSLEPKHESSQRLGRRGGASQPFLRRPRAGTHLALRREIMAPRKLLPLAALIALPACVNAKSPATTAGVTEVQGEAKPHVNLQAELERIDDELTDVALRLQVRPPQLAPDLLQQQLVALKLRDVELRDELQAAEGMTNEVSVQRVNSEVEQGTSALDMDAMRLELAVQPDPQTAVHTPTEPLSGNTQ